MWCWPSSLFDLYAIAKQTVGLLVKVIEAGDLVAGDELQLPDGLIDESGLIAGADKKSAQVLLFDITVILFIFPVTQVVVFEPVAEKSDDAILGFAFQLSYFVYGWGHSFLSNGLNVFYRLIIVASCRF